MLSAEKKIWLTSFALEKFGGPGRRNLDNFSTSVALSSGATVEYKP
jgi:hypothetical protein